MAGRTYVKITKGGLIMHNLPEDYKFCPTCGKQLKQSKVEGQHNGTSTVVAIRTSNHTFLEMRDRAARKGVSFAQGARELIEMGFLYEEDL